MHPALEALHEVLAVESYTERLIAYRQWKQDWVQRVGALSSVTTESLEYFKGLGVERMLEQYDHVRRQSMLNEVEKHHDEVVLEEPWSLDWIRDAKKRESNLYLLRVKPLT